MQLVSRVQATQSTVDRFLEAPFQWGVADCAQLAAHQLRGLGYPNPLAGTKPYGTLRNARKAMKAAGVESLVAYLDERFERIAPAQCVDGDLIALPAEGGDRYDGWVAMGVYCGHERVLAFVDGQCRWGRALAVCTHAWRVPPIAPAGGAV